MIIQEVERLLDNVTSISCDLFEIDYLLKCPKNSRIVLESIKEVLLILNRVYLKENKFESIDWKSKLPKWFISKCRPEKTEKEKIEYLKWWDSLSIEEKNKHSQKKQIWSLKNWLHWMAPDEREWYWGKAEIISENEIILTILVFGHPFPDGSLKWLVEASGCTEILEIDCRV